MVNKGGDQIFLGFMTSQLYPLHSCNHVLGSVIPSLLITVYYSIAADGLGLVGMQIIKITIIADTFPW